MEGFNIRTFGVSKDYFAQRKKELPCGMAKEDLYIEEHKRG